MNASRSKFPAGLVQKCQLDLHSLMVSSGAAVRGIGVDLLDASRVERLYQAHPERFAKRILTEAEWSWWIDRGRRPIDLAKQFAAKEALAKALGTGIAKGVGFQQMCVGRNSLGAPMVQLSGQAVKQLKALGANSAHLSLSDEGQWVIAFALISSQA